ncbi:MAG TPA: response regulator [Deltaproteobacteria bacterium]|nr:response regulator [Deltaproteobacteria bacterium]HOM29045.1 response regulator [Deltaproteobacteria bacterium]HPP80011.1 response regulator [Deltaproteobacteria bacterium]
MSDGLDVVIVDDEYHVCGVLAETIGKFYTWGEIVTFQDYAAATEYCLGRDKGLMVFVLDVFVGQSNGFAFLDSISEKYPNAAMDTVMISGMASDDVVDMCVATGVSHLLEKPVRPYALQLAIRSIVMKYIKFAKRLLSDSELAGIIDRI